ncbi:hypothetical protein [Streptomyces sp. NPDC088801]|uniref:hypothetical protein n=1 Tax=Streptomyces sp. NPDC088801 TaxID=3365903 RepID=UPI0038117F84
MLGVQPGGEVVTHGHRYDEDARLLAGGPFKALPSGVDTIGGSVAKRRPNSKRRLGR